MTICGRCGTTNSSEAMRCVECEDYLHQYRREPTNSNPALVSSIIAGLLGLAVIGGAFLPFIQVADVIERRMADSPDGLIILGSGLLILIAAAIDGFSRLPRYVKPVCLTCGLLILGTMAFDVNDLKTRTATLLQSVNALTSEYLPKFEKFTGTDLMGAGLYSEVVAGFASLILGLVGPVKVRPSSRITETSGNSDRIAWRLSINPVVLGSLGSALLLVAAYSYALYTHPRYSSPVPGRGVHAVMAHLDPERPLPDRVVISYKGIGRHCNQWDANNNCSGYSGSAIDQMYVSVYRFNLLSWDLVFRSPGDVGAKPLIQDLSTFLSPNGDYQGGATRTFLGLSPLGSKSDKLIISSLDCGGSCASEMIHVVAWQNDRLVDVGSVANGFSRLDITVTPTAVRLQGPGYASGDGHCCPSIKNDDGAVSLSADGNVVVSGGTYQVAETSTI